MVWKLKLNNVTAHTSTIFSSLHEPVSTFSSIYKYIFHTVSVTSFHHSNHSPIFWPFSGALSSFWQHKTSHLAFTVGGHKSRSTVQYLKHKTGNRKRKKLLKMLWILLLWYGYIRSHTKNKNKKKTKKKKKKLFLINVEEYKL